MNLNPIENKVFLRLDETENTSKGGIVLPDSATTKPNKGIVLAVGPGKVTADGVLLPMSVKAGDHVLFGKYAQASTVKVGDEYLIVIEDDQILAVLEEEQGS